jgi:DNA recombination protein RmuC
VPITIDIVLVFAAGLVLGALITWLLTLPATVRLRTVLEADRAANEERVKIYRAADLTMREAFQALSADALQTNNRAFLDLAESRLREAKAETVADLDLRRKAIDDLFPPLRVSLERLEREIGESQRSRARDGAQLLERIALLDTTGRNLRAETARLADALKRPGVRGRWGELQLKRVVELAGMVEHCDFEEQSTIGGDDRDGGERRFRPDLIVRLPGGKHIVVDAKAPLEAYLKAIEAPDEPTRMALLADHARQVRTHLMQLAAKGYAAHVRPSPDFVVMFLPGEMFFSAALEQDPALIEFGVEQRVIPASPTTLIALLRAVAYGWQQKAMEENAQRISDLGRALYEATRRLGEHVSLLGTRFKSALDAYNQVVGSLEGNILVKARKFRELQVQGSDGLDTIEPIDRVPRMPQAAELTEGLPFLAPEHRDAADGDALDLNAGATPAASREPG